MAKYTDPNTGVKYSTHTGLKVFTVIVVILLVVSIVLNVVLYMQNSDDSELDAESGEIVTEGDGDGSDGDGENPDGILPDDGDDEPPALNPDDYIDTKTVVENENTELTTEFDEYGVAKCLYYYDDCGFVGCEDGCVGHEYYLTTGGGIYEWYPILYTQLLLCEDGSVDDINSKIRVSLVALYSENSEMTIDEARKDGYDGQYYTGALNRIEIASLTGEPLQIESIDMKKYIYYERKFEGFTVNSYEYHSANGLEVDFELDTNDTNSDTSLVYDVFWSGTCYMTVTIALTGGKTYHFDFWVGDPTDYKDPIIKEVD